MGRECGNREGELNDYTERQAVIPTPAFYPFRLSPQTHPQPTSYVIKVIKRLTLNLKVLSKLILLVEHLLHSHRILEA